MNQEDTFDAFVRQHEGDDPFRLLLSRDRFPGVDIDLAANTLEARRRLRTKVPEWYAVPSLRYPTRLCAEQCSSSPAARYKAGVAAGVSRGTRIADLTGGLGVDSWAFAESFTEVLYNEADTALFEAVRHNFGKLGFSNVTFRNAFLEPGKVEEILSGFRPDIIYLDPARRSDDGRKVFLLEQCSPDITALAPELLEAAPTVLVKLSPMADISMVLQRLPHVQEVHVVASGGECKELLVVLSRGHAGGCTYTACEDGALLRWRPEEESAAALRLPEGPLPGGGWQLFEPGKALAKAGAFRLPCQRFGLTKLGLHTHLYMAETVPEDLLPFGKVYDVQEVLPLNKQTLRQTGKRFPKADVTARNLPLTSDELRRRLGAPSGGGPHLFGLRADLPEGPENLLLVTTLKSKGFRLQS